MDSSDSSHICSTCNKPVDLQQDRYADEDARSFARTATLNASFHHGTIRPIRTIRNGALPATQLGARSSNSFLPDSLYCEISQQIDKMPGMAKRTLYKTITVERAKAAASKAKSARSAEKKAPNNASRKG
jgi:hypothetical protein